MIKKLHIQNYQSHKDSTFEFEDGINTLIGRSDSGKSAVWRSLYWLAFNSPGGDFYRSDWGGDTIVEVWLDDGTHVQRIRTDKENMYVLNNKKLKAIGRDVPKEIQEALNLTAANFQGQLDPSFLLMGSPGEVAKIFNEYLDLECIDLAVQTINGSVRKNSQKLSSLKDNEKETREALSAPKFQLIEDFEKEIKELQEKEAELTRKEEQLTKLNQLLRRAKKLKASIIPVKGLDALITAGKTILQKNTELENKEKSLEVLKRMISRIIKLIAKLEEESEATEDLEERKNELMKDSCPICGSRLTKIRKK